MSEKKRRGKREPERQVEVEIPNPHRDENLDTKYISIIETELAENMFHQRGQARESALKKLTECFRRAVLHDWAIAQRESLVRAIDHTLLSTGPQEQILSCHLLQVLCVTVGPEWEDLFEHFKQPLVRMATKSTNNAVRIAGVETLAVLCFVWSSDIAQTEDCLNVFSQLLAQEDQDDEEDEDGEKENFDLVHSAIDMWCVLCTTISPGQVVDELIPHDCSNIVSHLRSEDLDLRLSAGEALAYISSVVAQQIEVEGGTYSPFYFNSYMDVQDVLEVLQTDTQSNRSNAISPKKGESVKKGSKKDRLVQRQGFNRYLTTFEEGAAGPQHPVTLTISHHQCAFKSWVDLKRLEFFRDVLQEGLLLHFQENPLLSQIFDQIELSTPIAKMSKHEKRKFLSGNSVFAKGRTQNRTAGRDAKLHMIGNPSDNL